MFQRKGFLKAVSVLVAAVFFFSGIVGPDIMMLRSAYAESLNLSPVNQFIPLSNTYSFPILKGLKFDPANPLEMKFIIDTADKREVTKEEAATLIRYFLASLTIPEEEIWVNLSPYEEDKIIPPALAQTDLGKDLLSQDYLLKQLTSSLTYPESDTGKDYWDKTYTEVLKIAKTTKLPVNTFNKIWIVPEHAQVYESGNTAFIAEAKLKAMLEEDYLALRNKQDSPDFKEEAKKYKMDQNLVAEVNQAASKVMKELILPKINEDVNSGKNFATLRQVYHSLILGIWFKKKFKDSIYSHYINQQKVNGIDLEDKTVKEKVYQHYVEAFKKGLYDYIKTEPQPQSNKRIKRRYYSGGFAALPRPDLPGNDSRNRFVNVSELDKILPPVESVKEFNEVMRKLAGDNSVVVTAMAGGVRTRFSAPALITSSPIQIRTELKVPEGQKENFFTNSYQGFQISNLLKRTIDEIPEEVIKVIKRKLDQDVAQGRMLSAIVTDFAGTDIDIHTTHRYGELNTAVHKLMLEALRAGLLKAKELGLLKEGIDIMSMSLGDLAAELRLKVNEHSITERGAEPVVIAKIIGAGVGAANVKLYHEFFIPGATPLEKLGFLPIVDLGKGDKLPVRGFRAIVRRTEDVLKGNSNGPVWEFERSSAVKVITKEGKEILYSSKNETVELLALAGQPNDFLITAIYPVEGSTLPSTEAVVTVVYQPVYGEKGGLRTLNPTFICRSQSGADAVAGVAGMYYDVNFVPGGPNGENFVATKPVTLEEARRALKEGIAHVVVYGWQSKGNGVIPKEEGGIIDHVAMNPEALKYERRLADFLASVMITHRHDQPYVAPFATQARVEPLRKAQGHLFSRAPKEADIDPFMNEVESKVVSGEFLSVTDDKADMGGKFGHNFTPEYMLAIDKATVIEATENGILSDGNIIGFVDKMRLKGGTTPSIGDDSHVLMLGDKSRNSAESHQLSFLAFTRGYLASMVGNREDFQTGPFDESKAEKPYGRAQDYQGKEAKAAKKNPYFYSHLTPRFFEILREVMPLDYMQMVDNMEKGWKHWQEKGAETTVLLEPFSGNVSQQGIGSARYLVDITGGERTFGILAGDKMGPAALNRIIREGVYAALKAGKFKNGLVFEIWDAKAFDEHGNIPLDKLPEVYADVADAITSLQNKEDQGFVRGSYKEGALRADLTESDKERLAQLLKESGYVPTERIFLDAQADKEAIYAYLADSDRFNIKQVWDKKKSGWDINNPQAYLSRPALGSSVTKLGILAGGEYIGKDDPVMVGNIELMEHIWAFLKDNPLIIQGDMNGSHWLAAIPTAFKYAVANKDSHPILVGLRYTLSDDDKALARVEDVFGGKDYGSIRQKMFKFNHQFKQAQLGGQVEPYGTNWRTVEGSYPLSKLLKSLTDENSPFLVKNKSEEQRKGRPVGVLGEVRELFNVATASSSMSAGSQILVLSNIISLLEGAQTGGYSAELAFLDGAQGGIFNHSERRRRLEVMIENLLQTLEDNFYGLSYDKRNRCTETLKSEGLSDKEISVALEWLDDFVSGRWQWKDEGLQRNKEVIIERMTRDIVNYIMNIQLKKIIAYSDKYLVRQTVLCVGETKSQYEAKRTQEILEQDLKEILEDISPQQAKKIGLRVAYEPRWAIGTGLPPRSNEIQGAHRFIKDTLSEILGIELEVDYGGSLNKKNAETILSLPDVDGGLIGTAAKTPDDIAPVIDEAIKQGGKKGKLLNIGMNWKAEDKTTGLAKLKDFLAFFQTIDLSKVQIAIGTPQVRTVKSALKPLVSSSSALKTTTQEVNVVSPGEGRKGGIDLEGISRDINPAPSSSPINLSPGIFTNGLRVEIIQMKEMDPKDLNQFVLGSAEEKEELAALASPSV